MAGNRVAVFDSDEVHGTLAGITLGKDFPAEETWVIEAVGESFEDEVGANGDVVRFATHDKRLLVKLKVKGSSVDNQKLSALHALDTNSPNGAGIGAFLLKDAQGASLYAGQGWILGIPPNALGKKRGDVEWRIRVVPAASPTVGGN